MNKDLDYIERKNSEPLNNTQEEFSSYNDI